MANSNAQNLAKQKEVERWLNGGELQTLTESEIEEAVVSNASWINPYAEQILKMIDEWMRLIHG